MDFITLLSSNMPSGFWASIIGWFQSFIGNYGWTIVVFTICLNIVLIPVTFIQRKITRNNTQKQAILQPEVEKIKKKYAGNEQMINQKTMELYKANNYNVQGTCFGLLFTMIATMAIFITLWTGMTNIANFKIGNEYKELKTTYVTAYNEDYDNNFSSYLLSAYEGKTNDEWQTEFDALTDEQKTTYLNSVDVYKLKMKENFALNVVIENAQEVVSEKYGEIKEGWLWVKNIFRPDNNSSIFPKTADEFISLSGTSFTEQTKVVNDISEVPAGVTPTPVQEENVTKYSFKYYYENLEGEYAFTAESAKEMFTEDYTEVTGKLVEDYSGFNGYFILIILAGAVTLLSQLLGNMGVKAKNKKGDEVSVKNTNKFMLFILPAIMIYFTWRYSAAFAIYIIVNSLMSALIGFGLNLLMNKLENKKEEKKQPVVEYSRKK